MDPTLADQFERAFKDLNYMGNCTPAERALAEHVAAWCQAQGLRAPDMLAMLRVIVAEMDRFLSSPQIRELRGIVRAKAAN